MRSFIAFATSFLLSIFFLHGQNPIYRTYDGKDGLPSSEVYDVVQDEKGYIWFTTDHGLARFDGYQFKSFNVQDGLPESSVFYMFPSRDGAIWFTSLSGVLGHVKDDVIHPFPFNDTILDLRNRRKFRFLHNSFHLDQSGTVYFASAQSAIYSIEKTAEPLKVLTADDPNAIYLLEFDNMGLLGTFGGLDEIHQVILYKNKSRKEYLLEKPIQIKQGQLYFESKISADGKRYFSTQNRLFLLDNDRIKSTEVDATIITFDFDKKGYLWVSTISKGVFVYDAELNLVKRLFTDKTITGFLEDHEGGIWFTTLTEGIIYIPYKDLVYLNTTDGLPNDRIVGLEAGENGEIWFAGLRGHFGKMKHEKVFNTSKLIMPAEASLLDIFYDHQGQRLFLATNYELFTVDPTTLKTSVLKDDISANFLHNRSIKTMMRMNNDASIWRGHYTGISRMNIQNQIDFVSADGYQFTKRVEALASKSDGVFWIGTTTGLHQYNDGRFIFYGNYFPLLKQRITSLLSLGDTLWIGTRGNGLYCFVDRKLTQYSVKDGLVANNVNHLAANSSNIFIGTNRGLSVLDRKNLQEKAAITNLVAGSGLAGNEVTSMAINHNTLYVSTPEGISIIPQMETKQLIEMPVLITGVNIAGNAVSLSEIADIPYVNNQVVIRYFAISFRNSGKHTYRHRLLGLDIDWIEDEQTTAQYPYLPPGSYRFEVQVKNPDGQWGTQTATYNFTILSPIWMRWWFIILTVIGIIVLLIFVFRWLFDLQSRRRRMVAELNLYRQEALTNQMNPHFLFNALNTVQRYILENDKVSSSKYLTKFSGLMRITLNNSQAHQISVENEINALNLYLELESARFKDKFIYKLHYSEELDPKTTFIPVFLVQPLVENALRHGLRDIHHMGQVEVAFLKVKNDLVIRVTDNGIGRKAARSLNHESDKKSLGISIIQKRLSLMSKNNKMKCELVYIDREDENGEPCGTIAEIINRNYFIYRRHE